MEVNHKEFLESQVAMTKEIIEDLLEYGEDEPVFAVVLDIDTIGEGLIVNYWYANYPQVGDLFAEDENLELVKEHEDWLEILDALTKHNPKSVVAMTLLELLDVVREQLESYNIRIVE